MPITERRTAAIRAAKRAPKSQLHAFVTHWLNTKTIGPQRLDSDQHPFVRRGWCHPGGRITADGAIVGRAYMGEELP